MVLPGGRLELHAEHAPGTIGGFIGLLADRSSHRASLDELNGAAGCRLSRFACSRPQGMKITADTTVLVRALGQEDPEQVPAHQGLSPCQEGNALLEMMSLTSQRLQGDPDGSSHRSAAGCAWG